MKTFSRIAPPRNAVNVLISGVPVGWTATATSPTGERPSGEREPPSAGQADREMFGQHVVGGEDVQAHGDREQQRGHRAGLPLRRERVRHQSAVRGEEGKLNQEHRPGRLGCAALRSVVVHSSA